MEHEQMEEIKRYFGVVAEGLERKIQQVAEGVVNLNEKLDREMTALRQEMRTEFGEVKSILGGPCTSHAAPGISISHELCAMRPRVAFQ